MLLPALSRRAELTLWTDQGVWDPQLEQTVRVRSFDSDQVPWRELNEADFTFFNIGNNPIFHGGIWQVSRKHAGGIILHDFCLQDFFVALYSQVGEYCREMTLYYGNEGLLAANQFQKGDLTIEQLSVAFPLTPLALENALCAVIHNQAGHHTFSTIPVVPIIYAPLPYSVLESLDPTTATRERASERPFQIIIFGFIGANRRVEQFLEAWAGMPEKAAFRLHICGEVSNASQIVSRIRDLGLADFTKVFGYLSDEDLNIELARANLAVNLRYPTMGEASLTQLLIWDHALPTLVTRVGWYATLDEGTVAFVRPEHEIEDIRAHLRAFLKQPENYAEMGRRGQLTVRRDHAPGRYAETLLSLADRIHGFTTRNSRLNLAKRVGQDMSGWITPSASNVLSEKVARAIWEVGGTRDS